MKTVDEYVAAVQRLLPPWLPRRATMMQDLRSHVADRVAAGEGEYDAVARLGPPEEYAEALMEGLVLTPAPHGRRLGAFMVDVLLGLPLLVPFVFAVQLLMSMLFAEWPADMLQQWRDGMISLGATSAFVFLALVLGGIIMSVFVMSVVYFPLVETVWGTTIGKRMFGLAVSRENGTRVTLSNAIVRRLPFYFEFFWLDAIFALFTRRRQRAFDHVAKTVVVVLPAAR